jgi:hypothetical protein
VPEDDSHMNGGNMPDNSDDDEYADGEDKVFVPYSHPIFEYWIRGYNIFLAPIFIFSMRKY